MDIVKEFTLLAALILIVGGSVFAVSNFGQPSGKYDLNVRTVISGATDGAGVKSITYQTKKSDVSSWLGLSFVGPESGLAFTGAENVYVTQKLIKDGEVVVRKNNNFESISSTSEETVTISPRRIPGGNYLYRVELSFECAAISDVFGCPNQASTDKIINVPKSGVTS